MNQVTFHAADKPVLIKNRSNCKNLIRKVFSNEERLLYHVLYIFCSDEYLLKLNLQHLKHDFYTDVLSFLISLPGKPVEGEIYISSERIKENAKLYNVPYQNELLRVMIHGALHFCGYLDNTKKLKEKMQEKENAYLRLYNNISRET